MRDAETNSSSKCTTRSMRDSDFDDIEEYATTSLDDRRRLSHLTIEDIVLTTNGTQLLLFIEATQSNRYYDITRLA